MISSDVLVHDLQTERPHVVILGAGASRAAFPCGERNGIKLPLMNDLVEMAGLKPVLYRHGHEFSGSNFEELYSALYGDPQYGDLTAEIERAVLAYFAQMQLPDAPTLYDHLVLSLRAKDVIATFNWDPLLAQACLRNRRHVGLPRVIFLHGNVAMGYCSEHRVSGPFPGCCVHCGRLYLPSRLLLPIADKDYSSDPYICAQWNNLRAALERAYLLTIFGYAAPNSDVEARRLMEEAWGDSQRRELEETEIIDIREEDELAANWSPFICSHHYRVVNSFYESMVAGYPRRSCEAMWRQLMELQWVPKRPLPWGEHFSALYAAVQPLTEAETNR